jgi:serine/threonine-protein kinase
MSAIDQLNAALAGRYTIERELGAGGMATVYLAHDLKHDRHVALKVLRSELAQSLGRDRFLREIQLAAKLSHPHILPLYDSGDAGGALFYAMPNVEGQSLRDRLKGERMLPVDEAVRITMEVAGALDHAHRHGIVHRDVKPENIMLQDGHALVADFGIGKAVGDIATDTLTQSGMTVGTPAYMSPEQAVGEPVDGRSDLYSLGCVLYEMLVGEQPFTGPTVQAVIAKRFVQTPPDVAALREGVPRPVARAVQKALARIPIDRYDTAALFVTSLGEVETAAAKPTAPEKSLAVLPFENLSADKENEYFGDGIAEDIMNALVQIDGLHIAARNSAFSFRGKQTPLTEIGQKLNVATVLQGSVRKSGNRLRITAQLVSVTDGYHLWSERYDRDLTDVFAVQDEIAGAIAAKLRVTFVQSAQPAPKATSAQVEAFELVARGRALTAQRGHAIIAARECFERAIALEPDNAEAHAGLGETLVQVVRYGLGTVSADISLAKAALARALALDPRMAQAMGTLGTISMMYEHDPQRAFELWERALALQPRLSELRAWYALCGLNMARHDDERSLAELARATADDPLSAYCAALRGLCLAVAGHMTEGAAEAARAVGLDPQAFVSSWINILTLSLTDDVEGALAAAERSMVLFGRHPFVLMSLPRVYMKRGDARRAEAIYAELIARAETGDVARWSLSAAAHDLGRTDEAMEFACQSVERRDNLSMLWTRDAFADAAFRAHPRYPELLRAMGL